MKKNSFFKNKKAIASCFWLLQPGMHTLSWKASTSEQEDLWTRKTTNYKHTFLWKCLKTKNKKKLHTYILKHESIRIPLLSEKISRILDLLFPLLMFSLPEFASCFPLISSWYLNTSIDYDKEQYKSNSLCLIKLICLKQRTK